MKYKILSIAIAMILVVSIILSITVSSLIDSKAPRYHQHLEAEEKEVCKDHGDDVFCSHLPVISIDASGVEIPSKAYYDEEGNRHYTTTADGGTYVSANIEIIDNMGTMNHLDDKKSVSATANVRVEGGEWVSFVVENWNNANAVEIKESQYLLLRFVNNSGLNTTGIAVSFRVTNLLIRAVS